MNSYSGWRRAIRLFFSFAFLLAFWLGAAAPGLADQITITDLMGRQVVVKQPVERVVLTFNFEEYFAVAGEAGPAKVVGWSRQYWEGRRQATWDVFIQKYPGLNDVPDIGYIGKNTFNVEAVMALKPDLVLMSKYDFENARTGLEKLEAAGLAVIFVDYHQQTLKSHQESTLLIGRALGQEERAEELAEFYRRQTAVVGERLEQAGAALKRPKTYMEFSDSAGPSVFGPSYGKLMWGGIMEQCAADNIARELVKGASAPIMPEQILAANPDLVIFAGNQFPGNDRNIGLGYTSDRGAALKSLETYGRRPGWNNLNAVKNKRMHAMYHDLSRHIFDFAGLQFIAKAAHPELFRDLDPEAGLREFHERFYLVPYSGTWFLGMDD